MEVIVTLAVIAGLGYVAWKHWPKPIEDVVEQKPEEVVKKPSKPRAKTTSKKTTKK